MPFSFSVAAEGAGLSYQWRRDGAVLPGGFLDTFSVGSAGSGDAGQYSVVVSDLCSSAESDPVTLEVLSGPLIEQQPASVMACPGESEELSVGATTTSAGGLSYQWFHNGLPIPGAVEPTLSFNPFMADDLGAYEVRVTDKCFSVMSQPVIATLIAPATIEIQPQSHVVSPGTSAVFAVFAKGAGPLGYQWFRDDEPIGGATSFFLVTGIPGTYRVAVTNPCGATLSEPATLTLTDRTQLDAATGTP